MSREAFDGVRYEVFPDSPNRHVFRVVLSLDAPAGKSVKMSMAAWIPGSYMIRDFAKNIVWLTASCGGNPVAVEKLDKQTWRFDSADGALRVEYEVYAFDLSVRGAYLDQYRGFYNGTSLFLRVHGWEQKRHLVDIKRPRGGDYTNWRLATSLPRHRAKAWQFGNYVAENYDELIDHPVEMADFEVTEFEVAKLRHMVVISGKHQADLPRLARDLKRICTEQSELMGDLPVRQYLFLVNVVGNGYGGLEHKENCSLICSRDDLPAVGEATVTEGYRRFLGLCSHEYFHLWNVKRIRPKVLQRASLEEEVHTRVLWAFEGITSYYDDLTLLRAGCIDENSYLELLAQTITRVHSGSGRLKQTLEDSSFDAWTKFYKQDENAPNAVVSYYTKGALFALTLDLRIRQRTNGTKSLDDVMRALWKQYGAVDKGLPEAGFESVVRKVTGQDFRDVFDKGVRSTQDLPLDDVLAEFGVGFRLRPAAGPKDTGGVAPSATSGDSARIHHVLGARVDTSGADVKIQQVFDDGAAQQAGLAAGDVLIAVDGIRVSAANLDKLVDRPETLTVHAFRRDELIQVELTPKLAPANTCELWLMADLDADTLARRRAWLGGERS